MIGVSGGAFCFLLALSTLSQAAVLYVGPGRDYATPCAAVAAASDGDTILIDAAGSYSGDVCSIPQNGLTLQGVNGRPQIDAAGNIADDKAIWVIDGNDVTVDNIEFSGATDSVGNGAGIRAEGGNITVRNSYFHDNQMGLLSANLGWGDVLIETSEFFRNGRGNGYTHNIYVGEQATFTMQFCWSHQAVGGQLVKSRAAVTRILYNRLTGESGSNYEIDIPNGGQAYVIGNVIQQPPDSTNSNILAYMLEGTDPFNTSHQLFVANNTFVNNMSKGTFINIGDSADPAVIQNNIFYGAGEVNTQGAATMTDNFVGDPQFVDVANYDYHLQTGSPAIGIGSNAADGSGQSLAPLYQYVHPTCGVPLTANGAPALAAIDDGAYQSGLGNPLNCDDTAIQ